MKKNILLAIKRISPAFVLIVGANWFRRIIIYGNIDKALVEETILLVIVSVIYTLLFAVLIGKGSKK